MKNVNAAVQERMPNFRNWLRPAILVSPLACLPAPLLFGHHLPVLRHLLESIRCADTVSPLLTDAEQHCLTPVAMRVQSKTSESEERGELVAVLVGAAVAFGVGIYATLGADKAAEYFAGYLLEQSLSVDNLFVFVLIFDYFKVDQEGQDKVRLLGLTDLLRAANVLCK